MQQLQSEQKYVEKLLEEVSKIKYEKFKTAKTETKATFIVKVDSIFCKNKLKIESFIMRMQLYI